MAIISPSIFWMETFTHLTTHEGHALDEAQSLATANGAPCGVWHRDGWWTVCDVPPEIIAPDPTLTRWELWAVVDPMEATS